MEIKHLTTWIPIIGIITGLLYGLEDESPVQTHTILNSFLHGVSGGALIIFLLFR